MNLSVSTYLCTAKYTRYFHPSCLLLFPLISSLVPPYLLSSLLPSLLLLKFTIHVTQVSNTINFNITLWSHFHLFIALQIHTGASTFDGWHVYRNKCTTAYQCTPMHALSSTYSHQPNPSTFLLDQIHRGQTLLGPL